MSSGLSASATSHPQERACRILVVDDEQPIRATVAEILDDEGYPVATAANGAEALQILDAEHPCVVLLDMRMPVLDGWGFMRGLRERGAGPAVLVMTAAQNALAWATEVGADGYLAKPFDLLDVLAEVERLCSARAASKQIDL